MAANIMTVKGRAALAARREPYWHRLKRGQYVGFRKMTPDSPGTWLARVQEPRGGRRSFKPLGDYAEIPDGQRFDAASSAARLWFAHLDAGGSADPTTVRGACERYVEHLRSGNRGPKAAADAEDRFARYVLADESLAALPLDKLTPAIQTDWRRMLATRPTERGAHRGGARSASTLNRDMTCFRAALNHAFKTRAVASDHAWAAALLPIQGADRRRELYLTKAQRRALIDAAPGELRGLLRCLCALPLRPGAAAALTVGDFDPRLGVVKIGVDKAGAQRKFALPAETLALFSASAEGKDCNAPLFSRPDGRAWDKDAWKGPVKDAARAAGLPSETTAYALRHSTITDLVVGGLDLSTVATLAGTSVRVIEQHYAHLRDEIAVEALARLAL